MPVHLLLAAADHGVAGISTKSTVLTTCQLRHWLLLTS
jgi:hypothetical protein